MLSVARALLPSKTMSDLRSSLIGPRFLAASLLLHAAVLIVLPANDGEPRPARALNVQLAAPALAALRQESPSAVVKPRPSQPAVPKRPLQQKPSPLITGASPAQLTTAPDERPTLRVNAPPTEAAISHAIPSATAPPAMAATTTSATEPRERRGKPSTLWLAEYTQQLSGQVGRQKQYPQIARLRGWQGTAIVAIQLSAEGNIVTATIAQSTGHDVLDQQALSMIRHAGPLPALPYAIAGDALTVQLPIVFALAAKD